VITHNARIPVPVVVALLAGAALAQSPSSLQQPALTTAKNVIYNELHPPSASNIHWKYRVAKTSGSKEEIRTVVETRSGSLDRLVALAGRPLNGAQQDNETNRILKFCTIPTNSVKQKKLDAKTLSNAIHSLR